MNKKIKNLLKKQGFTSEIVGCRFYVLGGKNKANAFTLVELIIVIAIIAVLAIAAFMMLTKWLGHSRDSRRIGDMATIQKALEVTYSDTDRGINMYPNPTDAVDVTDMSGAVMWNQGVFGLDTIAEMDNIQKAPQDPGDESYYKYSVTLDKKEFQLGTVLEDGSDVSVIGNAFAAVGEAKVDGNYDGYVSYPTTGGTMILKTPSLLVYGDPMIGVLSGTSDKFMVGGQSEGEEIVLKSIKTTESTTPEQVAEALDIEPKFAAVVMKKETGAVVTVEETESAVEPEPEGETERSVDCGGEVPDYATKKTAETYIQILSGDVWGPELSWGENQEFCDFDCNSGYIYKDNECKLPSSCLDVYNLGLTSANDTFTLNTTSGELTKWCPMDYYADGSLKRYYTFDNQSTIDESSNAKDMIAVNFNVKYENSISGNGLYRQGIGTDGASKLMIDSEDVLELGFTSEGATQCEWLYSEATSTAWHSLNTSIFADPEGTFYLARLTRRPYNNRGYGGLVIYLPSPTQYIIVNYNPGWHHLCSTMDSSGITTYLDGQVYGTKETFESQYQKSTYFFYSNAMASGTYPTYSAEKLSMDEVMLIGKALTDSQIKEIFDKQKNYPTTTDSGAIKFANGTYGRACTDYLNKLDTPQDGVYWIDPDGDASIVPFKVYCDMSTNGGGWTLVGKARGTVGESLYNVNAIGNILNTDMDSTAKLSDAQINGILATSDEKMIYAYNINHSDYYVYIKLADATWNSTGIMTKMRYSDSIGGPWSPEMATYQASGQTNGGPSAQVQTTCTPNGYNGGVNYRINIDGTCVEGHGGHQNFTWAHNSYNPPTLAGAEPDAVLAQQSSLWFIR